MKTMLYITALLTLFMACNKNTETTPNLNGKWGLTKTQLFENGELNGTAVSQEITTYYIFENCESQGADCRLTILEDGEQAVYNFEYNSAEQLFILENNNLYQIESLDEVELVFYKDYSPYQSKYTFEKIK